MSVEIFKYDEVILFRFSEVWAGDDLATIDTYVRTNLSPPIKFRQHRLVDLRQTRESEANYLGILNYVSHLPQAPPPGLKIALVVTASLIYGYARMLQMFIKSEGPRIEIFGTMDAALNWLDVSETARHKLTDEDTGA
jgi:hypothetical protein